MLGSSIKAVIRVALGLCLIAAPASTVAADIDVRILIDVSGSMKANDPQNLRIPAVRLVAELMPLGATAGIWTFSERVEQLIAANSVDRQWKAAAIKATERIHSRGQFTDVEAALNVAIRDWEGTGRAGAGRHVILLTDGVVDVSAQATDSALSRKRILDGGIARIKSYGAQIHTIALSANSDRELMTTIAESTDGWAEEVEDAASLQRVFLHMFEQAASPDSIPLLDNRFEVDKSISEMTLLVFGGRSTKPLQLLSPAGTLIDEGSHPNNINWRAESGYDLVTVTKPETGTWQINTEPDPDNRVLIVTDLKLELDALPTSVLVDELLTITAGVSERGQPLVRRDFLKLLHTELSVSSSTRQAIVHSVPLDKGRAKFISEHVIDWPSGEYELVVKVDGGTFQREQRSKMRIHGAPITFSSNVADGGQSLEIVGSAEEGLVALESLAGFVLVAKPDGSSEVFDLPSFFSGEISLSVAAPLNGVYQIEPRVIGRSASGRVLNFRSTAISTEITAGLNAKPEAEQPAVAVPFPAEVDWVRSGSIVLIGNVFVLTLLGVVWLLLGQRRQIPSSQVVLQ
jgi:uncharacterized protein (TIGR03503 family)